MKTSWIIGAAVGVFVSGLVCGALGKYSLSAPGTRAVDTKPSLMDRSNSEPPGSATSAAPSTKQEPAPNDFTARFDALLKIANTFKRARVIAGLADDLSADEVRQAIGQLEKHRGYMRDEVLVRLYSRWGELDPAAALQYLRESKKSGNGKALNAVIASWAAQDSAAAEKYVLAMPKGNARQSALTALVDGVARNDREQAFRLMLETSQRTSYATIQFFADWAEMDPAEAAKHVLELPKSDRRNAAIRDVAQKWAETDIKQALAWAESSMALQVSPMRMPGTVDQAPLGAVFQTWLKQDTDAAMQWLKARPDDAKTQGLLELLSNSVAADDPKRAVEIAVMMSEGKSQDDALQNITSRWADKDMPGALAWVQLQTDDHVRQTILPSLAESLAFRDPSQAAKLALGVEGKAGDDSVGVILYIWTGKDPAAAAAWAGSQPDASKYLPRVATVWATADVAKAGQWISTFPDGSDKDAMLAAGAQQLVNHQPQAAADWIAGMSDEDKRLAAYKQFATRWLYLQPKTAQAWLETAPLPQEVKVQLLQAPAK